MESRLATAMAVACTVMWCYSSPGVMGGTVQLPPRKTSGPNGTVVADGSLANGAAYYRQHQLQQTNPASDDRRKLQPTNPRSTDRQQPTDPRSTDRQQPTNPRSTDRLQPTKINRNLGRIAVAPEKHCPSGTYWHPKRGCLSIWNDPEEGEE